MKTKRTSDSVEVAVMRILAKRFKTAIGRDLVDCKTLDDYKMVVSKVLPESYTNSSDFSKDWFLKNLLRKWEGWGTASEAEAAANEAWRGFEEQCFYTNQRINNILSKEVHLDPQVYELIWLIQEKIEYVIGSEPDWEEILPLCRLSSGATYDCPRAVASPGEKLSLSISATRRSLPFVEEILPGLCEITNGYVEQVRGDRRVAVPKDADILRIISAGPTVNGLGQQGIGRSWKRRLKRVGIDLFSQKRNQELAFAAIVDELCTIDLKGASDTICYNLVELLFPSSWFDALERLRSPLSREQNSETWTRLEKFSSMGNAYTFELETLIFWAITSSVVELQGYPPTVSVYGDDIICSNLAYDDVIAAFKLFGFTVNSDKSFKSGPFYESCGKHYFNLDDVTPIYQKAVCGNDLFEIIRLHNRVYRWGMRNDMSLVKDACSYILEFAKAGHSKRSIGFIPDTFEDDRAFLAPAEMCKVNKNGDYIATTLTEQVTTYYQIGPKVQDTVLYYKLRNFAFQNVCPDGHVGLVCEQNRRLKHNDVVWRSGAQASPVQELPLFEVHLLAKLYHKWHKSQWDARMAVRQQVNPE